MTNEIATRNATYAARYDDPFNAFAREGGPGIVGKLLTCKKGVWGIGVDADPVPADTRLLFIVPELRRGWVKWQDT